MDIIKELKSKLVALNADLIKGKLKNTAEIRKTKKEIAKNLTKLNNNKNEK